MNYGMVRLTVPLGRWVSQLLKWSGNWMDEAQLLENLTNGITSEWSTRWMDAPTIRVAIAINVEAR